MRGTNIIGPIHLQEVIFDEFRQAQEGIRRGGTGLGLAIVRKLVVLMGGSIRLDSHVDKGSTFVITLPLVTETNVDSDTVLDNIALADSMAIG